MIQHQRARSQREPSAAAEVIDLAAVKAGRRELRLAAAEGPAVQALAAFRAGHGSFTELMRALVAPFNAEIA